MRIHLLPALIIFLFTLLTDWYILIDVRKYSLPKRKNTYSLLYIVSAVLCWGLAVAVIAWPKKDPNEPITTPMWILFVFLSIYLAKFVYCIFSLGGRCIFKNLIKRKKWNLMVAFPMGLLLFLFMWWGVLFTRNEINVNNISINTERLPKSMSGLKIVQISDLHLGTWGSDTTFVSKMVDAINAQNADVVVFTGDFVNRVAAESNPFVPVLKRVNAPMGVYAVYGNHDYGGYVQWPDKKSYYANLKLMSDNVEEMGWSLLSNASVMLRNENDSIALIGVENWGEPPFNQLGDLVKAYEDADGNRQNLNDSVFKVLLTHNPNHWDEVVKKTSNVDLTLSGHTHAMQMEFDIAGHKFSPSVWKYPKWGGLYDDKSATGNPMYLYVNIGAGTVGFPARLGSARPEITTITLKNSAK